MIVARATHWNDRRYEFAIATGKNAVRLVEDATLLQAYDRFGTAYTLAKIAFEEAGSRNLLREDDRGYERGSAVAWWQPAMAEGRLSEAIGAEGISAMAASAPVANKRLPGMVDLRRPG